MIMQTTTSDKVLEEYNLSRKEFNYGIGYWTFPARMPQAEKDRITANVNSIPKNLLYERKRRVRTEIEIMKSKATRESGKLIGKENALTYKITDKELDELGYSREEFNEVIRKNIEPNAPDEKIYVPESIDINTHGGYDMGNGIHNDIFRKYEIKYCSMGECQLKMFSFKRKNQLDKRGRQDVDIIFKASNGYAEPIVLKSKYFFDEEYLKDFVEIAKELLKDRQIGPEAV